mmetsp:Transcript_15652/g.32042  ORF Transcript_15652/g.32042 Transcript_15652/m.32042 type:complete len:898 (+) Transcript_15652:150-2843(+)
MLILTADSGEIKVIENPDESDETITILRLRLEDKEICTNGERGIQSAIAHPNFVENMWIYIFYTSYREGCLEGPEASPQNVVDRFRMDPDTLQLDKGRKEEIWRGAPTKKQNHNGGALAFGNDGKLYLTTGDGGDGDTVQPLDNTHGSIIRLNDDGSVPGDNPFSNQEEYNSYRCADSGGVVPKDAPDGAVCSEVFANGLRNPFRITIDPTEKEKTKFAVSDVGGSHWEELSWAGTDYAGRNYGYPIREGPCLHGYSNRCQLPWDKNYLEPFHWYAHRRTREGGCVTGSVYVPEEIGWPSKYKFMFADFIFFDIYNLIEDPDASCRSCRPPTSGYTNETFYTVPFTEDRRGSITDIFFGPYEDTQALYVLTRGGKESVIRIRYTGDVDNSPPVPVIKLKDLDYNYVVGQEFEFDGSDSSDPDDDGLEFAWEFGDGTASKGKRPTHAFDNPGTYEVTMVVTDTEGISQQASMSITVGKPPTVTISKPKEGDLFFTGQVFNLTGKAFDSKGERLKDSQLTWEVHRHHADHFHPFLDPTNGNKIELFPAPEPEDYFASTNSYLRIILKATDNDGLTTEVDRLVMPWKVNVDIESDPPGIEVTVDAYPLRTSEEIVSWKGHKLNVVAYDQPPYNFQKWWDGNTEQDRRIEIQEDGQVIKAIYCAQDHWLCTADAECCSGLCKVMACASETSESDIASASEGGVDIEAGKVVDLVVENERDIDTTDHRIFQEDVRDSIAKKIVGIEEENNFTLASTEAPTEMSTDNVTDAATYATTFATTNAVTSIQSSLSEEDGGLGVTGIVMITMACSFVLIVAVIELWGKAERRRKMGGADASSDDNQRDNGLTVRNVTDQELNSNPDVTPAATDRITRNVLNVNRPRYYETDSSGSFNDISEVWNSTL